MKIVKESLNNLNRVIDNKDIKANTELSVTETQAYLDGKDIDKHLDDVDKKLDKMVKDSNVEVKTERPKRIRGNKMYVGKLTLDENLFESFEYAPYKVAENAANAILDFIDDLFALEDTREYIDKKDVDILRKAIDILNDFSVHYHNDVDSIFTESKKSDDKKMTSDEEDFWDYDMSVFITNLFTRDLKQHQRPLNPLKRPHKHFEYYPRVIGEPSPIGTDVEGNILIGTNNIKDFDDLKEICNKYKFKYSITEPANSKFKYSAKIIVPKTKSGTPLDIQDYFESIGIPIEDVMPEWYIKMAKKVSS